MEGTHKTLPQIIMTDKQWNNGVPIFISKEKELEIRKESMDHADFVKGILVKLKAGVELTPEEAWYYKLHM